MSGLEDPILDPFGLQEWREVSNTKSLRLLLPMDLLEVRYDPL